MDYKYIEQLLERYFAAETSLEEESILRTFFHQEEIPAHLYQWRALFIADDEEILGDDFDARMLSMVEKEQPQTATVKAREIHLSQRLMPLFKAAAVVAIFLTLGQAAQFSIGDARSEDEIDYASYKDTYEDPAIAYDKVQSALQLVGEGFNAQQPEVLVQDSTVVE